MLASVLIVGSVLIATTTAPASPGGVVGIPRACEWTEWQELPGKQQCRWQNKSVGVINQDRQENRFVTYCSQMTRQRRRRCEGGRGAHGDGDAGSDGQLEFDFRQPTAFQLNGEHPDGDPVPVRSPDDPCQEERCPPLDGQWCYWIVYSSCDYHCRHAAKNETEVYIQKKRLCSCPRPRNRGRDCQGASSEREKCACVSLSASFASFLRTTEGIFIACGICAIVLVLLGCCVSRVCCDTDDGTEDFKISELPQAQRPQQQQQQQHSNQEPLLLNLNPPGDHDAETDLCSLSGCSGAAAAAAAAAAGRGAATGTNSNAGSRESPISSSNNSVSGASLVVRLPSQTSRVPPPLPPKRYKEQRLRQQQQQQQQQQQRRQKSFDPEPPLKYTPPFPNEV